MSGEFVDTNILVYAHDPTVPRKHAAARELVTNLWDSGDGVISVQVLQELFWTVTRKVPKPLGAGEAIALLTDLAAWTVYAPKADDVIEAAQLAVRRRLPFWDAMIVQAAMAAGAEILWSEDFRVGTKFDRLVVQSPF